jgi:hypothetical protein
MRYLKCLCHKEVWVIAKWEEQEEDTELNISALHSNENNTLNYRKFMISGIKIKFLSYTILLFFL